MSKAFDVLERMQEDRDLFRVPAIAKAPPGLGIAPNREAPFSDLASFTREEILRLVQRLFLATDSIGANGRRQIVFCGIDSADGSNLLCARIGRILAEQVKSQVCVVDANVRAPSSPLLDLLPFDGSSEAARGSAKGPSRRITDNLWLAARDPSSGNGGIPTLDDVQAWISGLPGEFAHVVISASPLGLYTDAVLLGQMADGVVLVLEANATRLAAARRAKQLLQDSNVRVLGAVLNNRTYPIPEKLYRRL
jgi:succinoglycan biosynthesis transport protein ExoP